MADLAGILGCAVTELPPVFAGLSPKPLAKGIHLALLERYPAADTSPLSTWLAIWASSAAYLHRLGCGGARFGLSGQPAGVVTKAEKNYARQRREEMQT